MNENKKILIVDDEPNIVMALEFSLKKLNYDVYIARDGSEALEIIKQQIPDVVLLDIMMPKVDGYKTLEEMKKITEMQNTKVIFISAKNKQSDIDIGMQKGADAYITKPFSIKNIVNKIEELLMKE